MSEKKLYSDRRWTDIPKPMATGRTHTITEEERKKAEIGFEAFLKRRGVLKPEDKIEDFKIK